MSDQLAKTIKLFAGTSTRTSSLLSQIPIKTNVLRRNGLSPVTTFGGVSNSIIQTPDNEIASFFSIVDECEQFRYLDFTKNILTLLTTDISNLIDDNRQICTVGDKVKDARIARILDRHNVRSKIKECIPDIVFYGSISYLAKPCSIEGKKMVALLDLEHPYSLVKRDYMGKTTYIMPGTTDLEINESNIVYMGSGNFKLKAPATDYEVVKQQLSDESKSYSVENDLSIKASAYTYHASEPLFYSITKKVKEYFVKDLLSTILSLRDAIQPIILTLNEEITRNGGDATSFNDAATTLESLINRISDTSITISEILEIDTLVNAVFSNIKVLPDPGGTLQSLNNLNLEELKDKLSRLKDGISDLKDMIMDSLGIPSDLWNGSSNSNEVLQKSERLQTLVYNQLITVKESTKHFIYTLLRLVAPELNVKLSDISLTLFRRSQVEYSRDQREITSLKDGLSLISDTLSAASEVIENNRFIDKQNYYDYLHSALVNISDDIGNLILPSNKIKLEGEEVNDSDKY